MSEVKPVQRVLLYQSYEFCPIIRALECLNEFAAFLKDVCCLLERCSYRCLLHRIRIWKQWDKYCILKRTSIEAASGFSPVTVSQREFCPIGLFHYSNEVHFFIKVVPPNVYYIVSEVGSNWISIESSDGQTLKLVQAAVQ
ncbi:unnamed protein product [Prunus armeniaca]